MVKMAAKNAEICKVGNFEEDFQNVLASLFFFAEIFINLCETSIIKSKIGQTNFWT